MKSELDDTFIRSTLERRRGEWQGIATASGVSYSWISQFMRGSIKNPGLETLRKLERVLRRSPINKQRGKK